MSRLDKEVMVSWETGWWRDEHHKREVAKAEAVAFVKKFAQAKRQKMFLDSLFYGVIAGVGLTIASLLVFIFVCISSRG